MALSHNTFDAALYLGVCDKIVPGLVIAAATFGHLPGVFVPAGPMTSGIANDEKSKVRQRYATGDATREELMASEMAAYHGPGTCTFYGTANTNQMLMEFMGLHLPGASFVNPNTPLREALTVAAAERALAITARRQRLHAGRPGPRRKGLRQRPGRADGHGRVDQPGPAPARHGARRRRDPRQSTTSPRCREVVPLMAKVYPNGLADVNHFHAAGGLGYMIGQLLDAGLLHDDVRTVAGDGLDRYRDEPSCSDGALVWERTWENGEPSLNDTILRPPSDPFQKTGGLAKLAGNLGTAVMKVSAVAPERHVVEAKARVFDDQEQVKAAFRAGEFTEDTVVVVRFQGPGANGMPELHSLTPTLAVLQDRGLRVALVTDGRMSGASGKVPAAIHVSPEAAKGGPLAHVADGDMVRVDARAGTLDVLDPAALERPAATMDAARSAHGTGRELFALFRNAVSPATEGASPLLGAAP